MTDAGKYRPVQALGRGLQLLEEMNRFGRAKPSELSVATGIDRTTVYRLLHTLELHGLVVRTSDDRYALTLKVRQLSEGFTASDWAAQVVGEEMVKLLNAIRWPSDFGTFEAGTMLIRESTHRYSPYSVHRAMIGRTRPVLSTAMGRAVLASVTEEERDLMLELIIRTGQPDALEARRTTAVAAMVAQVQAAGYASQAGEVESGFAAIALPVRNKGHTVGAINIIFFRSALSPNEAAARYLSNLRETVAAIESELADGGPRHNEGSATAQLDKSNRAATETKSEQGR